MAERKPYTTKTRQIILEYLKRQPAVTVSVSDIEEYLKDEGIRINTTTVYRYLDKLCTEHIVIKYPDLNSDKAVFQFAGEEKKCTEHLHLKCIKCGKIVHLDCDFFHEFVCFLTNSSVFNLAFSSHIAYTICTNKPDILRKLPGRKSRHTYRTKGVFSNDLH